MLRQENQATQLQLWSIDDKLLCPNHKHLQFSFVLQKEIPETFEGSWYTGKVLIGLKDAVFQSSSPLHHASKLHSVFMKTLGLRTIPLSTVMEGLIIGLLMFQ